MFVRLWHWIRATVDRRRQANETAAPSPQPVRLAAGTVGVAMPQNVHSRPDSEPRPISTNRILALKALDHSCGQQCVDWAICLIEQGRTERHVLMLAGMSPPFNYFEMAELRDRALAELGFRAISRSDALRIYAADIAQDAQSGQAETLATLRELNRLCIDEDYAAELQDFYSLYFAWDDLLTSHEQWYWPGATRENIAAIAHETLSKFVADARERGLLESG